jgi:hypothetical protein
LAGSIFYCLAYLKTANPLFPFYNEFFKSPYFENINWLDNRWKAGFSLNFIYDITFFSSKYGEAANGSLGISYLLVIIFIPCILLSTKRNSILLLPFLIGVYYLFVSNLQVQYLRYSILALFLVYITYASYLNQFFRKTNSVFYLIIASIPIVINIYGLRTTRMLNGLMHIPYKNIIFPSHYRGTVSEGFREESLTRYQYAGDIINSTARNIPKILMLGCQYGSYFNADTIYVENFGSLKNHFRDIFSSEIKTREYLSRENIEFIITDPSSDKDIRKNVITYIEDDYEIISDYWELKIFKKRNIK